MIITLDGPAGAGKSTLARLLATQLCFEFLDTGAMYRAVALAALRSPPFPPDNSKLSTLLEHLVIRLDGSQVFLNEENVTEEIRSKEATDASGLVASIPLVRQKLVDLQRLVAHNKNMVCEGRDQGTVVFPQAVCKFFLTASPEVRAKRRFEELSAKGLTIPLNELANSMRTRDERDATREVGPLAPASDAILLDTSNLSTHQVLDKMLEIVRLRQQS